MKSYAHIAVAALLLVGGCGEHTLGVSDNGVVTEEEIVTAIDQLHPGMHAEQMVKIVMPVANTWPVFKKTNKGNRSSTSYSSSLR